MCVRFNAYVVSSPSGCLFFCKRTCEGDFKIIQILRYCCSNRSLNLYNIGRSLKDTLSTVESFLGLQHFAFNTDRSKVCSRLDFFSFLNHLHHGWHLLLTQTQSSLDFLSRVFNALRERISHYYYPTQAFPPRPSKKMEMLPDTRRLLDQIYSTHNTRLRELLEKSPNPQHRHLLTGQGADWLRRS